MRKKNRHTESIGIVCTLILHTRHERHTPIEGEKDRRSVSEKEIFSN